MLCKLTPLPADALNAMRAEELEARKADIARELAAVVALKRPRPATKRYAHGLRQELIAVEARLSGALLEMPASAPGSPADASFSPVRVETAGRIAKVYHVPRNAYHRHIEFQDGTHGIMVIRPTERLRAGWNVRVEPHTDPAHAGRWRFLQEWP